MMPPLMLAATLLAIQAPPGAPLPDSARPDGAVPAQALSDGETPAGAIEGTVRAHEGTNVRFLPYAIVQATMPGDRRTILADSLGRYRIEALPAGSVRLQVSHVAHRTAQVEVTVPDGGTVLLDIDLEWSPIVMHRITVVADQIVRPRALRRSEMPIPAVEVIALGASTGLGEAGLSEAIAAMPGNDPSDPSHGLFMRGSTTDLKLVLLDGAPVYTPFHLGGLLSSFDAASLGEAALHTGGAPARYDGGLSYVLDLRTRPPQTDRLHVRGGVDLISANIAAEGPIGRSVSFSASSRTLHDYGTAALGGGQTPYGYRDALGRIDARLGEGHLLSATAFWNRESVFLNPSQVGTALGAEFIVPEDASWGNHALVIAYHGSVADVRLDATVSASGYRAELPLRAPQDIEDPFADPTADPTAVDDGVFPLAELNDGMLAEAETNRLRLTLDGSTSVGRSRLRFGTSVDRTETVYSARSFADIGNGAAVKTEADGVVAGVYADGVRTLAPGLDLRVGLRADAFSTERGVRLAPRVAFLWSLSDEALLTVAAGRYHQFSRVSDRDVELSVVGGPLAASTTSLLSVATADHVVVSLDQELRNDVRLGIEGFWKEFTGLGGPGSEVLRSSGIDIQVLREGAGVTAWLGYNLSWFWSGSSGLGGTGTFAARQLLSAGLRGSPDGRIGGAVSLGYTAGLPYTSIPFGDRDAETATVTEQTELPGDLAQEDPVFAGNPDDGFLRLDVELFTHFTARMFGRDVNVRPYLRLINALDQRDALFYYFEPWRDSDLRPLAERSFLPVFGVEWRF